MTELHSNQTHEDKMLELAIEHCWNWFSAHAAQRMQLVNFYVLAIAFVTAAYVASIVNSRFEIAAGVSVLSLIASFVFWRLEVRTRHLVRIGRSALQDAENRLATQSGLPSLVLADESEQSVKQTGSYAVYITSLYAAVGVVYALGGIYATVLASK